MTLQEKSYYTIELPKILALLAQEAFDEVLILYGLKNFMEDSNLERME